MLDGKFKEKESKILELKAYGDSSDAIAFLRYLYTRSLNEERNIYSYVALMQTAHMYEVFNLLDTCERKLLEIVSPYSVCRVYSAVEKIASENFLNDCKNLMLKSAFIIFDENLHVPLSEDKIKMLLQSDSLNVLNEEQALSALWKWANVKCRMNNKNSEEDLKKATLKLVPYIRWSFIRKVNRDAPWQNLFKEHKTDQTADVKTREPSGDLSITRFAKTLNMFEIFQDYETDVSINSYEYKTLIRLSVTKNVLLIGLSMHIKCTVNLKNIPFKVSVNNVEVTGTIKRQAFIVSKLQNYSIYEMILEFVKPISLHSSKINTIRFYIPGSDVLAPTYKGKSEPSQTDPPENDSEVHFSTDGGIIGISSIEYFVRNSEFYEQMFL